MRIVLTVTLAKLFHHLLIEMFVYLVLWHCVFEYKSNSMHHFGTGARMDYNGSQCYANVVMGIVITVMHFFYVLSSNRFHPMLYRDMAIILLFCIQFRIGYGYD